MAERSVFRQQRFRRPPGATELLLVRHGESAPYDGTPFALVDGQGDPALAPPGVEQAERIGARLATEDVDAVYVTTLRRTVETAAPLLRRLGMEAGVEADLREVFLGEWEGGLFRQKVAEGDPLALRMAQEERYEVIPGAEPATSFAARVRGAVERIAARHPDERVAVFTHGGVIGEILAQATGSRPFAFIGADNGSLSHIVVVPGRWIVRRFNDTTHLERELTTDATPLT
ncbi:MAG: histidine phosphatase family protein [Acidimicrobiales bacterium]